ncbi:PRC-barrel domain-containing protein [Jannaschia marina]|uniref:PRC-barrel domain-containing protein n=1 Tax=Jannaschia marina TaxID=2741674 RepID=UPI0015CCFBE8|nr:PRC-barrel domain-containing protein [Jannaschia marina]
MLRIFGTTAIALALAAPAYADSHATEGEETEAVTAEETAEGDAAEDAGTGETGSEDGEAEGDAAAEDDAGDGEAPDAEAGTDGADPASETDGESDAPAGEAEGDGESSAETGDAAEDGDAAAESEDGAASDENAEGDEAAAEGAQDEAAAEDGAAEDGEAAADGDAAPEGEDAAGPEDAAMLDMTGALSLAMLADAEIFTLAAGVDDATWANEGDMEFNAAVMGPGVVRETVGSVVDVMISRDGQVLGVVAEVGGFLGLGETEVLLPMTDVRIIEADADEIAVVTLLTQAEIEQLSAPGEEAAE